MSKQQPGTHPGPEAMAAMIDGKLGNEERAALVHHLAECEECREALAEYARAQSGAGSRAGAWTRPNWLWMPVAATLMLATVAGVLVIRRDTARTDTTAPIATPAPVPSTPIPSPAPSDAPAQPPAAPDDLSSRRGGTRLVAGKTFRLVAGEWIDTAYDPLALLPAEIVEPETREATLARLPALRPYADLGPRFIVVHDGVVYRFGPR